jgi:hypothetical protein
MSSYTVDHAEAELKELMEQAQAEELTSLALNQGKPRCITPPSLTFVLN